jgi:glycosyltransferase involved in cell wall biosynthesis
LTPSLRWNGRSDEPWRSAIRPLNSPLPVIASRRPTNVDLGQRVTHRIFILLATYNGAAYLRAQLDSLLVQTHTDWVLYWRDDGSTDGTVVMMEEFSALIGANRCTRVTEPLRRVGPSASFMAILSAVTPLLEEADAIAFSDQDDIWLPDKLSRGVTALAATDSAEPALYCARLVVVTANLQRLGETLITSSDCGFPASLTQNIAVGCTIMMNQAAAVLVANHLAPAVSPHDWWCYLLVTASGGNVIVDSATVAWYRQHANNCVGFPRSKTRRAVAAIRRGPGVFMNVLRQHVAALAANPDLLSDTSRPMVMQLQRALRGSFRQKLKTLSLPGLQRQSWLETCLFRLWFVIG